MSRAYKCDRCGKLYESYAAENKYDGLKATSKLSTFILDRQDENLRRNLDMICKEFMNKVGEYNE